MISKLFEPTGINQYSDMWNKLIGSINEEYFNSTQLNQLVFQISFFLFLPPLSSVPLNSKVDLSSCPRLHISNFAFSTPAVYILNILIDSHLTYHLVCISSQIIQTFPDHISKIKTHTTGLQKMTYHHLKSTPCLSSSYGQSSQLRQRIKSLPALCIKDCTF